MGTGLKQGLDPLLTRVGGDPLAVEGELTVVGVVPIVGVVMGEISGLRMGRRWRLFRCEGLPPSGEVGKEKFVEAFSLRSSGREKKVGFSVPLLRTYWQGSGSARRGRAKILSKSSTESSEMVGGSGDGVLREECIGRPGGAADTPPMMDCGLERGAPCRWPSTGSGGRGICGGGRLELLYFALMILFGGEFLRGREYCSWTSGSGLASSSTVVSRVVGQGGSWMGRETASSSVVDSICTDLRRWVLMGSGVFGKAFDLESTSGMEKESHRGESHGDGPREVEAAAVVPAPEAVVARDMTESRDPAGRFANAAAFCSFADAGEPTSEDWRIEVRRDLIEKESGSRTEADALLLLRPLAFSQSEVVTMGDGCDG